MNKLGYTTLEIHKNSKSIVTQTAEQKYWKKYKISFEKIQSNFISCISSNKNLKNHLFFSYARTVNLFSTHKEQIIKEFTKFKDNITSLCSRNDGKMFSVGTESGLIQIFDVKTKLNLRTFDNHKKRVNALEYANLNDLYSGGDDMILRLYDVAAGIIVHSYADAHTDYIKSIKYLQQNHILTAGYDKKIKLFDFRVHQKAVHEFYHGYPIQAIDVFPNKLSFVSCGGNSISVFDIRNKNVMFQSKNNKKTVSTVNVLSSGQRFITGSIDQQLKIYRSDTFDVSYQQKYEDAIVSFDITQNKNFMAIGLNNGKILIKKAKKDGQQQQQQQEKNIEQLIPEFLRLNGKKEQIFNNSYFYRGIYDKPEQYDIKIDQISNKQNFYDKCLKKFEYKKAILSAILKNDMSGFYSLIDQITQRGVLERTIKSIEEDELKIMLGFLSKRIKNYKYFAAIIHLIDLLWQNFNGQCNQQWNILLKQLNQEIDTQFQMLQQIGVLQTIQNSIL